ncbi:MAG TPA: RNA-binding protein [Methanobacterium sp.]|nr:RNA-binding protein [Methanobacterium sp.]
MIHNISYRTFVYGTENMEKVKTAVKTLFPNSSPQMEETEGYYRNKVLILTDKIEKNRDIKDFIQTTKKLPSNTILPDLERKMDDKGNLFLRFDKQKAYQGELKVVEHGDSIHVKIKLAAYPAKKAPALKLAREIWG